MTYRIQRYSSGIAIESDQLSTPIFVAPSDELEPDERDAEIELQMAHAAEIVHKLNAFDALHDGCIKASRVIGDAGGPNAELLKELASAIALADPKS